MLTLAAHTVKVFTETLFNILVRVFVLLVERETKQLIRGKVQSRERLFVASLEQLEPVQHGVSSDKDVTTVCHHA